MENRDPFHSPRTCHVWPTGAACSFRSKRIPLGRIAKVPVAESSDGLSAYLTRRSAPPVASATYDLKRARGVPVVAH